MSAFEPRTYRAVMSGGDLVTFTVTIRETDLTIRAERDLTEEATRLVAAVRHDLETFLDAWPVARESFVPIGVPASAPSIMRRMADAAAIASVGPMAAVAGAVAEDVGRGLLAYSRTVIVENGGDVFMASTTPRTVALFAGASPLTGKVGFAIKPEQMPLGVCTSAGTVGHSTSFGRADAAVVFSPDAAIADAVATGLGNRIRSGADIESALDWALALPQVTGAAAVIGERMGVRGAIELTPIGSSEGVG